ncbi:MAG: response regulator [Treponema sp.]|nr:response regulator [Treponema sp.]
MDRQIKEQINNAMRESMNVATLEIQRELILCSEVARTISAYAESNDQSVIDSDAFTVFTRNLITLNSKAIAAGLWYEPFTFYPERRYFNYYIYQENGNFFCDTDYIYFPEYPFTEWYRNGRSSKGPPVWSGVYFNEKIKDDIITASVPIFNAGGEFTGVATADMSFQSIRKIINTISVGKTGKACLIGPLGEYISYFDDSRDLSQKIQYDDDYNLAAFGYTILQEREGVAEIFLNGISQTAYFKSIPETNWTLVVFIDDREISSSRFQLVKSLSLVPLLGIILAVIFISIVAGRLRNVANKVNEVAARAASGDLSKRIEINEYDEFGIMELNLNKMMDDMSALIAHSEEMLKLAQEASRAKSDFLSNMSHEMRTPMNAIIGMTSIGKKAGDLERKNYAFGKIEDASIHLLGVINDILDMSKIEANKFDIIPVDFNFEKMLRKVVSVINFKVEEKHQNFTLHIDKNIPDFINGDDQRLSQVITNLLSNAVKFTPPGGHINLTAEMEKEDEKTCTLRVTVKDSGIGISPEQQAKLFTSFQQAENNISRKFGGTGLGLAISKRIVEMMNGEISIVSELGKGAEFIFTAVLIKAADAEEKPLKTGINWKNVKVLAVDDEDDVRDFFRELADRIGFTCDTAAGGEEALRIIRNNGAYDIYFIDWKMPDMDGIELSAIIKKTWLDKSVVILISATDWNSLEPEARKAGVDKYLSKPLFPSSITDLITECLGKNSIQVSDETSDIPCFKGHRILIAEDVEINREIVITLLEPTQIEIECAVNGLEAVNMFKKDPDRYSMVFMDMQMPEMDGLEATRHIRAYEDQIAKDTGSGRRKVPIIAMTANVFTDDIEKCLDAGMNSHLGKPLNIDEVFFKLKEFLT